MFHWKPTRHEDLLGPLKMWHSYTRLTQLTYTNSNSYVGNGGNENGQHGSSGDGILGILWKNNADVRGDRVE